MTQAEIRARCISETDSEYNSEYNANMMNPPPVQTLPVPAAGARRKRSISESWNGTIGNASFIKPVAPITGNPEGFFSKVTNWFKL